MKNLFKKLLIICGIITTISFALSFISPSPASAFAGNCRNFLGMTSWDCGVTIENEDDLRNNIWVIAINVLNDITVIAAYLIIGYVIYGGYLYVFSGGEPVKVATGKRALYQAFLGLAIVMSANIIMNAVRVALTGGGNIGDCTTDKGCVTPEEMITNVIQWAIGIAGAVSVIFVVYGGISYATSAGEPSKLQKAKNMITYALIGLAVVALAESITAFVSSQIRQANEDAENSYINQTIISKEVHENQIN